MVATISIEDRKYILDRSMKNNYPKRIFKLRKDRSSNSIAIDGESDRFSTISVSPHAPHSARSYPALTSRLEPIEQIIDGDRLLAIIIYRHFDKPGTHFFTPSDLSQQLGYMQHPAGKVIAPHIHKPVTREVQYTQEVLLIKRGKLRVDFYNNHQQYIQSRSLEAGDVILLATGGHGFEVIEEIEMIEIKQGPYLGEDDRIRFVGISPEQVHFQG